MIWIIGGTTEARELIDRLGNRRDYIATIATEGGKEFLNSDNIIIGRLNKDDMIRFAKDNDIDTIIDLSHPYAKIVTDNARCISEELGIKYLRYVRKKTVQEDDVIYLNSYGECYEYLTKVSGTIFFTTGSKNIGDFEKVRGNNRFIYRILPAIESLEICRKYNIHMKDIIAILGPFSKDFNKTMLSIYNADYCVMKDSGEVGGTIEKLDACRELGIKPIVIGRNDEIGYSNLEDIFGYI
ncbi:precorrin-6A reductase [Tissierella sp. Yu-01]|uniref:precorrin-6A reductase n=1 Tax=Tissierella sp. Yu-01 TaxID=3035694 RepID=UPI00240DC3B8|nr:precorrin-6A reductase [Tissierella sp. Yu-01]WFA10252.1 precorrin-6A reductase [Tissierella sp. Yu-01]